MVLQGFQRNTLAECHDAVRIQASGNAYPVPLLMAVLAPMLEVVQKHVDKRKPVIRKLESEAAVATCAKFMKHMHKFKTSGARSNTKNKKKTTKAYKNTKNKNNVKKKKPARRKVAVKKVAVKKAMKKCAKNKKPTQSYRWISSSSS